MNRHVKCKVVAEGCCNHMGDLDLALKMTGVAKECGADYIKWQKRNPEESVPKNWHNKPHPNPHHAYGSNYLEHRKALEFNIDQHKKLYDFAKNIGIGYSCSVWDVSSAKEIISLNPDFIKIPSAMNNNFQLLKHIYDNYDGFVHISLGMTTNEEKVLLEDFVFEYKCRTIFYHTTSEYPVSFEDLNLLEIKSIKEKYNIAGYSGHNYGIAADVAAMVLGATWIERHFTLDRTFKGTDHAFALEKNGLEKLCRDIESVSKSLTYKKQDMTEREIFQRSKMKYINE